LNRTILFLLGDHGTKYTPVEYKNTTAQRLQENLPLLYIVLPDSFIEKHPMKLAHLLVNRFKVTSQFDIHATLLSLLQTDENTKSSLQQRLYGRNLFDDIGERHACSQANIPDEFCSCFWAVYEVSIVINIALLGIFDSGNNTWSYVENVGSI